VDKVLTQRRELRKVVMAKDTECEAGRIAQKVLSSPKYYAKDTSLAGKHSLRKIAVLDGFPATMMHGISRMQVEDAYFDYQSITKLQLGDAVTPTQNNPMLMEPVDPNNIRGKSPVGTFVQLLLSTRNRSQGAREAVVAWQRFVKLRGEEMQRALVQISSELRSLGVRTKSLSKAEAPLLYVNAKRSTPGIITSHMSGFRSMKDLHHYLLDTGVDSETARMGTAQLFNAFGKREVLFAKPAKATVGVVDELTDKESDVRIRMIQTVEGPERIESFKSEMWFNTGMLLSRIQTPIKKGLRIAGEWPLLVSSMSKYRYVVTIDIDNYDGNQHRGLTHTQALVRALLAVDEESLDRSMAHTCSVSHRITINRYGLATEVMGTMPSGDVNTTDDNSLRSWLALQTAMLVNGLEKTVDCDFGLSGDNIFIACNNLDVMHKIRSTVTEMGWPSRFDGIVETTMAGNPIVMPEFLGMIGVRFRMRARLVIGGVVTIRGLCAWRTPGRILPKLVGFNDKLSPKLMRMRTKQKAMLWLYTWPFDEHIAEVVNRLGATVNDLVQSKYNTSRKAGSITLHDRLEESSSEHSGKEQLTEDKIHAGWDWWISKHIGLPNLIDRVEELSFIDAQDNATEEGSISGPLRRGKVNEALRSRRTVAKPVVVYKTNCRSLAVMLEAIEGVEVLYVDTSGVATANTGRQDSLVQCACAYNREHDAPMWTCEQVKALLNGADIDMIR